MLDRIHSADLPQYVGKKVTLACFVQTIRAQGRISFIILRDVTGTAQAVVTKDSPAFQTVGELTLESVVAITGTAKAEKQAPGGHEVEVESIEILSKADPELPIPVVGEKGGQETQLPTRLDWRWIDLRKPHNLKIFKIWTELEKGVRKYFEKNGYVQFYSPSFLSTPSEGGAEVFEVPYFDRSAYLAQSPQFYKQMALAAGFEKVFTFGQAFRAEPSFTTRHQTEFTSWDLEIAFVKSHHDVMDQEEKLLVSGFTALKESGLVDDIVVPTSPFPRVTMAEAKKKLSAKGVSSEKEDDVSPEEERTLGQIIKEETGSDFVFLIDYPVSARPFYHMRHADNPELTKSFDLLYRGMEITTGAQREHRLKILKKQAKEKDIDTKTLQDYFNFFRYGCPPHGGLAIGPARLIMQLLNLSNIRESTFLPRDVKRLKP